MPSLGLIKDGLKGSKMIMPTLSKAGSKISAEAERLFQGGKSTVFAKDLAKEADRSRTIDAMKDNAKNVGGKAWKGTKKYTDWALDKNKHSNLVAGGLLAAPVAGGLYAGHKIKQGVSNVFGSETARADSKNDKQSDSQASDGKSGGSNLLKDGLLVGGGLLAGSALLGKSGPLGFLMKAGVLALALKFLAGKGGQQLVNGLDNGLKGFENATSPLLPESTDQQMKKTMGKANSNSQPDIQTDLKTAGHAPSDGASQNYNAQTTQQIGKVAGQNAPQAQNQAQSSNSLQYDGPESSL